MPEKQNCLTLTGVAICLSLLLSSCSSLPTPSVMRALEEGREVDVETMYADYIGEGERDRELALLEKGRAAQLRGDYDISRKAFDGEIEILKGREIYDDTKPDFEVNTGSVVYNDQALPYKAKLFEIELLRIFQALNYLAAGDLEGAAVEIRNAEYIQRQAEKVRSEEVAAASNDEAAEIERKASGEYEKYFEAMDEALSKVRASFLNAYVSFLAGVIYEMNGEPQQAYVSYKQGLLVMPDNQYLRRAVIRLAKKLAMTSDLAKFRQCYPHAWAFDERHPPASGSGRLVLLFEDGWAPAKREVFISMAAVAVAYPVYDFPWIEPSPLKVEIDGGPPGETVPICYVSALAVKALEEESSARIARQTARVLLKGGVFAGGVVMAAHPAPAVKAVGYVVMICSAIYNNASEKADLRSWLTLPNNVQIFDAAIPAGKHFLSLSGHDATEAKLAFIVQPEGTCVVRVIRLGSRMFIQRLWPAGTP